MHTDAPDNELLRAYATRRSETAFRALVERHVNLVHATAMRVVKDAGLAEDVAQSVFLVLSRKASFLLHLRSLSGWLYRTAILEAKHRVRSEVRRRQREEATVQLDSAMNADDALWKTLVPDLDDGLQQLTEKERQALLLRFFEQKNLREVGVALGVGEDAARKRVETALEKLTRFFQRRGIIVPGVAVTAAALRGAASVAPAGIASMILRGVAAAGGTAALSLPGLWFAQFMALTKGQTIALCLLLATGPAAYEWNRLAREQRNYLELDGQLRAARTELATREKIQSDWEARRRQLDASLGTARASLARLHAAAAVPFPEELLYRWSEESDHVRLPKRMVKNLALSSFRQVPMPNGQVEREQLPVFEPDGAMSEQLAGVLDVAGEEKDRIKRALQTSLGEYRNLEQAHTYETNQAPQDFAVGNRPSKTIVTTAFPEEGQNLQAKLQAEFEATLGVERANVAWEQASEMARRLFHDFGGRLRVETLALGPGDSFTYWKAAKRPTDRGFTEMMTGVGTQAPEPVPAPFRAFVAAWFARDKTNTNQP